MGPVDISGWSEDDEFSPYPEGSRDKYALIAPGTPADTRIVPNHRYLMKFSNPRYPAQFWSEIIAEIVGRHMGVPVPPCYYAEDQATGAPGSLISWFYGACVEQHLHLDTQIESDVPPDDLEIPEDIPTTHSLYVPGSSYMIRRIPGYDLKTGRQHNLKHIGYLLTRFRQRGWLDYWPYWSKMLTFDAIIGNTDRHQDNWGVLWRADPSGAMAPRFAPAFDNGTSLLHEITEINLAQFEDPVRLERYVRRGRHHLRWELEDPKSIPHLDLVIELVRRRPTLQQPIQDALAYDEEVLFRELSDLQNISAQVPLSVIRINAICAVMSFRRQALLQKLEQLS